jgi:hypothetical protein
VSTNNLINLVSTANLIGLVSSANLTNFISSIPANLSVAALFTSSVIASSITTRQVSTGFITMSSAIFYDALNANTANVVYTQSTFLYFNNYIIGGTRVAQPQWAVF